MGGAATEENGALLRNINHQWFNRLSKEKQEIINNLFREYKKRYYEDCEIKFVDILPIEVDVKTITFKPKEQKRKYDRAKTKREFRERVEEEWEI